MSPLKTTAILFAALGVALALSGPRKEAVGSTARDPGLPPAVQDPVSGSATTMARTPEERPAPGDGRHLAPPPVSERAVAKSSPWHEVREAEEMARNGPKRSQESVPAEGADHESRPETRGTLAVSPAGPRPSRPVNWPLAFQAEPSAVVSLTPAQQKDVEKIREQFIEDLGGVAADPDTPEYAAAWRHAQPSADDLLRLKLGWQGYLQYQYAAARARYVEWRAEHAAE